MNENKDEIRELQLKIKKLNRENRRLQTECDILKNLNEQVSKTQDFFHRENQKQICYNNQLLKTSPYILVMVNEKLETVMASDVFLRISDMGRDTVETGINLEDAFAGILPKDELKIFLERCRAVLNNHGTDSYLLTISDKEEDRFYQVDICYYLAQNEDAKGLSIILSDMTEIVEAKEKAENADKAKSNFLANMSHEIRTPMNAINGMAEFILRDSIDDEAKKNAAMIKSAARSLIAIINDILDFSKIESGRMEIINDEYSLSSLINDVSTMIRIRLEDKNVSLKVDVDSRLPALLYGDEVRIKQILINLLNNAVKFTNQGQITLIMRFSDMPNDRIRIVTTVADTGIGIKKEELNQIFESFTQADTRRNRSIEGTGLGLAICRRLVEMMGGELKVSSEYGKGSSFTFDIVNEVRDGKPIGELRDCQRNADAEVFKTSFYAPHARVLVVDDNSMNLKVAQGILKPHGIIPDCVESGAEALVAVQKRKYDLILMDHMMPVMDGVETMQKIRKMGDCDNIKIVALTANAINGVELKYRDLGFDDYLAKPIEPEEMEALLVKMIPDDPVQTMDFEILEFEPQADSEDSRKDIISQASRAEDDILVRLKNMGIDVDQGMHYSMGQDDLYLELVRDYVSGWKKKKEDLNTYYAEQNFSEYKILIHSIKSATKTIGMNDLSEAARNLEFAAKDRNSGFIAEHHQTFIDGSDRILEKMENIL